MTQDPENAPETPSVEEQRAELAATVEALAAKADVPTRVKGAAIEQAHHLKEAATEQAHHVKGAASHQAHNLRDRPEIIAAAVGVVIGAAVILGISRRRRSRKGLLS